MLSNLTIVLLRNFYSSLSFLRPKTEEVKSWGTVVDFRKGGNVTKEDFDRDIPYKTSKSLGTLQCSVPLKKKELDGTKTS